MRKWSNEILRFSHRFTVGQWCFQLNNGNEWVMISILLHDEPYHQLENIQRMTIDGRKEEMNEPSRTPKPNRWLNSNPAPLICQRCCFEGSNNWFRLAVRTVRCWTSRQVNCGLLKEIILFEYFYRVLLRFQYQGEYACCFGCSCWRTRMFQSALPI